ncbi:MAG: ribonuclease H-like domain-containing protein [Chromatiaceae bacterium]|nr:ribonuclease H-like domain-containing protein [Chromatiaceae bacterium]
MSLAGKIDRLRAASLGHEPDAFASRLGRLRRAHARSATGGAEPATLAAALAADSAADGLLMRVREVPLPCDDSGPVSLTQLPEICELRSPEWVYIDTETTGLSGGVGNLAFMIGVARYVGDQALEVRQFVLANFAAEAEMLRQLVGWIGRAAVLVSYNGKCFDLPLLAARLGMHRIADALSGLPHLDLMYSVRRAYRGRWPDCRLQTAEKRLLRFFRVDDLPGAEAPAAWRAWLDSGATPAMRGILQHNLQDLVSLACLHRRLVDVYRGGGRADVNHAALGRAWRDAGFPRQARSVWELAGDDLDDTGRLLLASLYRSQGDWMRAEAVWLALHARGNPAAALELSKYYEHRRRDYRKAIDFADHCEEQERLTRCDRLRAKVGVGRQLHLWGGTAEFSPRMR